MFVEHDHGAARPPPVELFAWTEWRGRLFSRAAKFREGDVSKILVGERTHTDLITTEALFVVKAQRRRPMALPIWGARSVQFSSSAARRRKRGSPHIGMRCFLGVPQRNSSKPVILLPH